MRNVYKVYKLILLSIVWQQKKQLKHVSFEYLFFIKMFISRCFITNWYAAVMEMKDVLLFLFVSWSWNILCMIKF